MSILVILLFGTTLALYRSRHRVALLTKAEREAREGGDRLLRTIHESRATLARMSGEQAALKQQLGAVMHAVAPLPLPDDIRSCHEPGVVYLPRVASLGDGRVRVAILGMPLGAHTIHSDPAKQTADERERIYHLLRRSREARAELGLGMT
jgi:hypothetical protein